MEKTKNYQKRILNFMLAYGGTDDMLCAIEKINAKYAKGVKITAEMLKENLMTANVPAVDYVIRTGGEPHNSAGFMMWDTANSQLYFSEKFYPDFGVADLEVAIDDFVARGRRLGA